MKPTRNIVKPNTGLWNPKGSVWFKKNDDSAVDESIKEARIQRESVEQARRDFKRMEGKKENYYGIMEDD